MRRALLFLFIMISLAAEAQQDTIKSNSGDLFDLSLEELLNLNLVDKNFYLYGYLNSNIQKTFDYPSLTNDGHVTRASDPLEWSAVRNFHLYGQGNLTHKISYLFNLAHSNEVLEIRNAWGNFAVKDYLQVRVGKMYRKFGLYNERLDQIPTFIGIEPPEMLDPDHLFLMRTTNFMIHGFIQNHKRKISYALMTDNGESGPAKRVVPLGWDLRYKSMVNSFIIGASGYWSSINNARSAPATAPGNGPAEGGILPWMKGDRFNVVGAFVEKQFGNLLIQAEYYRALHKVERDPVAVLQLVNDASINPQQRQRFLGNNSGKPNDQLTADDVITKGDYTVQTYYVRMGYNIQSDLGQFVPYVMVDWMQNPEVIQNTLYGGDNEAGLSDNGKFLKPSAGLVYRPVQNVAIKLDGSYHIQEYYGKQVRYPEIRIDFSFAFSNNQIQKVLGD